MDEDGKPQKKVKTLRQVFLRERITQNTFLKKLKEIALAFKEDKRAEVVGKLEAALGYRFDISIEPPKNHVTLQEENDDLRPINFGKVEKA